MTRISGFGEAEAAQHQARVGGTQRETKMVQIAVRNTRPKYGNKRIYEDRIWFDSLAELGRYRQLRLMERGGVIRDLVVHPVFPLIMSEVYIGKYTADFRYLEQRGSVEVVEDVKSDVTASKETFRRTLRLVAALYGIEIKVVY